PDSNFSRRGQNASEMGKARRNEGSRGRQAGKAEKRSQGFFQVEKSIPTQSSKKFMPNKAPAFQFYANDWLSSPRIMLMSAAQEGAYIRLLCIAWNDPDCSLPDDDEQLAILSRLGEGWFNGGSTLVRKCFNQHPEKPGRLVNLRLLEEREK